MKKIISLLFAFALILPAMAQEEGKKRNKKEERRQRISAISKQEEEGVIKYKKHLAFGAKLTSDGYGAFLEVGRAQSVKKGLLFQLEVTERKHIKEEKQQLDFSANVPLIYGKINFFYPVKLGVQQQLVLGNKGNKNGVSVTGNVGGGVIVGLIRPYMIDLDNNGKRGYISFYDDSTAFLNKDTYSRGPSFGTGWNRLTVTPGVYVKPAVRFDYGKYNEMINAIEVGVTAEYFTKPIQQMVFQKNRSFFISGYVAIVFGRRK
jgi:hypothetical protein